jgi:hypothetical protein
MFSSGLLRLLVFTLFFAGKTTIYGPFCRFGRNEHHSKFKAAFSKSGILKELHGVIHGI